MKITRFVMLVAMFDAITLFISETLSDFKDSQIFDGGYT